MVNRDSYPVASSAGTRRLERSRQELLASIFDFVCCNRIVWGQTGYEEIRIRHDATVPVRYLQEMVPVLDAYMSKTEDGEFVAAIGAARKSRLDKDKVDDFLRERFGATLVAPLKQIHQVEEDRPIENLYDVTTAVTAYARGLKHQDARVVSRSKLATY
jgi:hypothetical protein